MQLHNDKIRLSTDDFGLEPTDDPVWEKRARKIARLIEAEGPQSTEQILRWAARAQGWHERTVKNVLAWAELSLLACDEGIWRLADEGDARPRPSGSVASSRVTGVSLAI